MARKAYLGIQDAARKWRPPPQSEGSWSGSMVCTNDTEIVILVKEERWAKMKNIVFRLKAQVLEHPEVYSSLILLCQKEGHWDMELKLMTL